MRRFDVSAFDLDLSAFEVRPEPAMAQTQENRQAGRPASVQIRNQRLGKRGEELSRRAAQRDAERVRERKRLLEPERPQQRMVKTAKKVENARPDHLHVSSAQPRKERSRETCKERPEPSKNKTGRGASRTFVPWCSRRR